MSQDLQNLYVTNMPTDDTIDSDRKGGSNEIESKKNEINELNLKIENIKNEIELKTEQKNNITEMINLAQRKSAYSKMDAASLLEKYKELEEELKNTKGDNDDSIELLTQTELEKKELENRVADVQQEVEYMKAEKENMMKDIQYYQQVEEAVKEKDVAISDLKVNIESLQGTIEDLRNYQKKLEEEAAKSMTNNQDNEKSIDPS